MFDEFNEKFPPYELQKASGKHIKTAKEAVFAAVGRKKSFRAKPLIAAAAAVLSAFALSVGANAASGGVLIKFFMGSNEVEADIDDYVDEEGYRYISFNADIPIDEANFAVIFDIEARGGENVRVITDGTDRDFMERLRKLNSLTYDDAEILFEENSDELKQTVEYSEEQETEECGLVFRDSEICAYELENTDGTHTDTSSGVIGGEFMRSGNAEGNPSGVSSSVTYDHENGIKTYRYTFRYYVGSV